MTSPATLRRYIIILRCCLLAGLVMWGLLLWMGLTKPEPRPPWWMTTPPVVFGSVVVVFMAWGAEVMATLVRELWRSRAQAHQLRVAVEIARARPWLARCAKLDADGRACSRAMGHEGECSFGRLGQHGGPLSQADTGELGP